MKSPLIIIILLFAASDGFTQAEKTSYKAIAERFENHYNNEKYDSIFSLFSTEMKNALPLNKATEFLTSLRSQAGQITQRKFIKYQATYASYKTNFEKALFSLNISVDNNSKINGLLVKPFIDESLPSPERNITKLKLPFKEEWTVMWGGDSKEVNYHVDNNAQKNAFDFVITDVRGLTYRTNGQKNEDYYAFGKELLTPCEGEIVLVVDGIKDNKPGELNPTYVPGNTVIIKTNKNEYLFFAHFKQNSIRVKQGQPVVMGQVLGLCGNSGNSSEPHLHFHIQNVEDINIATGVKCYFDDITVNGKSNPDYSPIKSEKIKN
jgi:murein DD-endopeptidase MepM/ murein hydrolase activator NlpD